MADMVWAKHPDTGAVVEMAKSALPFMRPSGWVELEDAEVKKLEEDRAAARLERQGEAPAKKSRKSPASDSAAATEKKDGA